MHLKGWHLLEIAKGNQRKNAMPISWEEYKALVANLLHDKKGLYFRGQKQVWPLETTFQRHSKGRISLRHYDEIIIPQLIYPIQKKYGKKFNPLKGKQYASFLSLLQHHHFPTPLLDWTLCPYIAAYFAFDEADEKELECEVFVFDSAAWHEHAWPIYRIQAGCDHVTAIDPLPSNIRVIAQQGKFTVCQTAGDIEEYIMNHPANNHNQGRPFIRSFVMKRSEKTEAFADFNLLGINRNTLHLGSEPSALDKECVVLADKFFKGAMGVEY